MIDSILLLGQYAGMQFLASNRWISDLAIPSQLYNKHVESVYRLIFLWQVTLVPVRLLLTCTCSRCRTPTVCLREFTRRFLPARPSAWRFVLFSADSSLVSQLEIWADDAGSLHSYCHGVTMAWAEIPWFVWQYCGAAVLCGHGEGACLRRWFISCPGLWLWLLMDSPEVLAAINRLGWN